MGDICIFFNCKTYTSEKKKLEIFLVLLLCDATLNIPMYILLIFFLIVYLFGILLSVLFLCFHFNNTLRTFLFT